MFKLIILHSIFFWGSWLASPVISSDSFNAVTKYKPNIVQEIKDQEMIFSPYSEKNKETTKKLSYEEGVEPVLVYKNIPILLSQRHSGVSLWPFIMLNKITKYSFVIWHYILTLIFVMLLSKYIEVKRKSFSWKDLVFFISPLVIFQYPSFVSELFLPILFIFALIVMETNTIKEEWKFYIYGLVIGIGLLIRPNFLWFLPVLLIFHFGHYIREWKKIFPSIMIPNIPYLLVINWKEFFNETSSAVSEIYWKVVIVEVLSIVSFDKNFLSSAFDEKYFEEIIKQIFTIELSITSYFLFMILLYKLAKSSEVRIYFAAILAFVLLLVITHRHNSSYSSYLYGLIPIVILMWKSILDSYETNHKLKNLILILLFLNLGLGFKLTLSNEPVTRHSYNMTKKVIEEIGKDKKIYTLGVTDVGKFEYLSRDTIYPIHLYEMIRKKRFKTYIDILDFTKDGTLIFPERDGWSFWPMSFGSFNLDTFLENAKKADFMVNYKIVEHRNRKYYIIRYEENKS